MKSEEITYHCQQWHNTKENTPVGGVFTVQAAAEASFQEVYDIAVQSAGSLFITIAEFDNDRD